MKLKYVIYLTGIKILILKYDIKQIRFSVMNIASNNNSNAMSIQPDLWHPLRIEWYLNLPHLLVSSELYNNANVSL